MSVEIFFCYAPEDEPFLRKLKVSLGGLKQRGLIEMWDNRDIKAGTERSSEIDKHLNAADIILLLVSSDFISSEYCYGVEMPRAFERRRDGTAHMIWTDPLPAKG